MSTSEQIGQSSSKNYEELLAAGTRNLVCKEIQLAVNQLQEACSLISKQFGETADECADAYFQYGVSLLELSRMESGVLGNALQGITEEEGSTGGEESFVEQDGTTEEEKEKISEEILDAMLEPSAAAVSTISDSTAEPITAEPITAESTTVEHTTATSTTADDTTATSTLTDSEMKESSTATESIDKVSKTELSSEPSAAVETMDGDEKQESEDGEEEEDGESVEEEEGVAEEAVAGPSEEKIDDEEEVSNIQLAWEMLELAKNVYKRREETFANDENKKNESLLKQADCLMRLGEVSLETEQYLQSVEDFDSCRQILEKVLEPNHRRLAEIQYQIGLALSYATLYVDAIVAYNKALDIINSKIAILVSSLVEDAAADESQESIKKEIEELKELVPDIRTKIEDAEEEQRNAASVKVAISENIPSEPDQETSEGFTAINEESHPAKNISHLVRKKRKPDDEEIESLEDSTKKQKTCEKSNHECTEDHSKPINGDVTNGDKQVSPAEEIVDTEMAADTSAVNGVTADAIVTNGVTTDAVVTNGVTADDCNGVVKDAHNSQKVDADVVTMEEVSTSVHTDGVTHNGDSNSVMKDEDVVMVTNGSSVDAEVPTSGKVGAEVDSNMVECLPEKSLPISVDESGEMAMLTA